jgi:hypothetical protein
MRKFAFAVAIGGKADMLFCTAYVRISRCGRLQTLGAWRWERQCCEIIGTVELIAL